MGFNWCHCKCCFSCFYRRCFGDYCCRRNKTSPEDNDRSPPPSIALTIATASRSQADDQSIQDQLSLFHFGQKSPSGRRYSHPNQAKWVEEYERRKSQPGSPAPSINYPPDEPDDDTLSPEVVSPRPPESPVMQYPVIPPGRLLLI